MTYCEYSRISLILPWLSVNPGNLAWPKVEKVYFNTVTR